jgi:DMSO/TMAO reductase YedYZ molybdopterin-dependent catalytic subunit
MRRERLSREPENAQVAQRTEFTRDPTPAATHFTRNHYPTPSIDAEEWTLSVTGLVDRSADVTLADLEQTFSTETVTTTMECAENGRSDFRPRAAGHQWSVGALSTARWTGVPVGEVLDSTDACLDDDCWVAAIGDDAPDGEPVFARSLPVRKLLEDCLLAYEMNGHPLPAEHGAPVRLIVPGWYGTNSVKWLSRLHVMETMLCGPEWGEYTHWQQKKYRLVPQGEQPTERETIDAFDLGDQFADPLADLENIVLGIMAQHLHLAVRWPSEVQQHTNCRGFACTVRTQKSVDLTLFHREIQVLNRCDPSVRLGHIRDIDRWHG